MAIKTVNDYLVQIQEKFPSLTESEIRKNNEIRI